MYPEGIVIFILLVVIVILWQELAFTHSVLDDIYRSMGIEKEDE
jgi:hypothetical protein